MPDWRGRVISSTVASRRGGLDLTTARLNGVAQAIGRLSCGHVMSGAWVRL